MKIIKTHSVSSTVNIYNYTKTLKRVRSMGEDLWRQPQAAQPMASRFHWLKVERKLCNEPHVSLHTLHPVPCQMIGFKLNPGPAPLCFYCCHLRPCPRLCLSPADFAHWAPAPLFILISAHSPTDILGMQKIRKTYYSQNFWDSLHPSEAKSNPDQVSVIISFLGPFYYRSPLCYS